MRKGAIIQARMGSERLPGKVLYEIDGVPIIKRIYDEVSKSTLLDVVVVTTPDEELSDYCRKNGLRCNWWMGERNPLSEFYQCASSYDMDVITRITGDCPMMKWVVVDEVVTAHLSGTQDITYNHNDDDEDEAGDGLDVEVMNFDALQEAYWKATDSYDREHITPYIRRNGLMLKIPAPRIESRSLNTLEDYHKICELLEKEKAQC